ncbi:MAG: 50S ribosome-binding GTPase [Arcanobacterium sp.]|nr:50S ribosome-binding GTPase [Arcanobacterium sp.]
MAKDSQAYVRAGRPRRATLRKARALLEALDEARMPVAMPGVHELARARERARTFLAVQVIPQLEALNAPVVVVLMGSSGVGKSALFNALAGDNLSPASGIRPTTREPVMLVNPNDVEAMAQHPVAAHVRVEVTHHAPQGIALVDSPSFDYSSPDLGKTARFLLDAAQVVVYVTTAHRYGDGVAWDTLAHVRQRSIPVCAVLNRVPGGTNGIAEQDFRKLWSAAGFAADSVVAVSEGELPVAFSRQPSAAAQSSRSSHRMGSHHRERRGSHHEPLKRVDHSLTWLMNWISVQVAHTPEELQAAHTPEEHSGRRKHRGGTQFQAFSQLHSDVETLANGLDSARNATIDLVDKAREGAAQPLEKLSVNIAMGRFGQGAPQVLWAALVAPGGALYRMPDARGRLLHRQLQATRDAQLTELFTVVLTSVEVALAQGLTTAQSNIDRMWKNDAVNVQEFLAQARSTVQVQALAASGAQHWKRDVAQIARGVQGVSWLGFPGLAGLIGVAASGVVGAAELARAHGAEQGVWKAREALAARVKEAMEALTAEYVNALSVVTVPESRILREALKEFSMAAQGD